jgi:glycosyltransferase involved in cell wall biosynthesis
VTDSAAPPELSVVVPSVSGWLDLRDCIVALEGQQDADIEVVVVDRLGETVRGALRRDFPRVQLVQAPPATSIPALRRLGFRAARADVVGVIEDHVLVPPDWAARMLAAHRQGAMAVGGALANGATERLVDWAAFLCEYASCLAPAAGPVERLPGNNVTYRRALLERFGDCVAEDRWEDHLHSTLRAAGIVLVSRPEIVVLHRQRTTADRYARQRFLYSRSFAGQRVAGRGGLVRAARGLGAVALPPVLLARIVRAVWATGQHRWELLAALPLLAAFVTVWAAGEAAGAWLGPGRALAKVA